MSTATEGKFEAEGATLYCKTWTPSGAVAAKLIFVHGFSEHINRYNDFFSLLAAEGIQVLAWDQRGWGRSVTKPSERGLTGPTSKVIADIVAFIKGNLPSEAPIFVMGHSMGGGEVLVLMGDSQFKDVTSQIRGWILECPFVAFTKDQEPSSAKVFLGRLAGRLLPKYQLKHVVPPELLTRDPVIAESIRSDPLCHDTGTLEGLGGQLDRAQVLASGRVKAPEYIQSVLLAHGKDDKVCSYDAAMHWLDEQTIEDKTAISYDGAYHQLHSDHCKADFTRDLTEWILKRSQGSAAEDSKAGETAALAATEATDETEQFESKL